MEGLALQIQNGILSPNEARLIENMNKREDADGDEYWRPLNLGGKNPNQPTAVAAPAA